MKQYLLLLISTIFFTSCGIYSFTGASIPADAKTVSVQYFTSNISNFPVSLNETITEGLKDIFLAQTNLELSGDEADLNFSGEITKYQIKPMAIQANETASQNRLTIGIKVKYTNSFNNKESFESTFNRYRDFNSSENLTDVEEEKIQEITKELIEDVFNKAFVNW